MAQTPQSIINSLKENEYAPLYLLHGEEPFYIDFISDYIENNALVEQKPCREKPLSEILKIIKIFKRNLMTMDVSEL